MSEKSWQDVQRDNAVHAADTLKKLLELRAPGAVIGLSVATLFVRLIALEPIAMWNAVREWVTKAAKRQYGLCLDCGTERAADNDYLCEACIARQDAEAAEFERAAGGDR